MAFIITTDGQTVLLPPGRLTLKQMQKAVGGYIEHVHCPLYKHAVYCNEDGKILGLPINEKATILAGHLHDPLCGDVLFLTQIEQHELMED
jgi:hypothetical protein